MTGRRLHAADVLLPTGWARDVLLEWDEHGDLIAVTPDVPAPDGAATAAGPVVPGLTNLHSHAFQRVFAGLAEFRGSSDDSFWSWRERMYRVANAVTPGELDAIATWLFVEMLEGGYTSVCEFHYLHNDVDGRPYADDSTLAARLVHAADRVGLGVTLLPVLYQQGGFDGVAPTAGQRRFVRSTDTLLRLVEAMGRACDRRSSRVGLGLHSLRAVTPGAMQQVLGGLDTLDRTAPLHIHVAEQPREVEECLAWSGQRPVAWLLEHAPVDQRWCLVHATHMSADEAHRASATGAVAGLCPTTEANLGDGVFDWPAWTAAGFGRWGVGSDSHITVNAAEELRLLEYSQRLRTGRRNVAATSGEPHVATAMTLAAVAGGAAAAGRPTAGLTPGQRADFVVLDGAHPLIAGLPAPDAFDAHVFASHRASAIDAVVVGGQHVVQQGRHAVHAQAAEAFVRARAALLARL